MDHAARVAAATSRSTHQRALVRSAHGSRRGRNRLHMVRTLVAWLCSAEIAAQPVISAD
jgi:hypothetical protein